VNFVADSNWRTKLMETLSRLIAECDRNLSAAGNGGGDRMPIAEGQPDANRMRQALAAFVPAWRHAQGWLCQRVNEILVDRGVNLKVAVPAKPPADQSFADLNQRLLHITAELQFLMPPPRNWTWLAIGHNRFNPDKLIDVQEVLSNFRGMDDWKQPNWRDNVVTPMTAHVEIVERNFAEWESKLDASVTAPEAARRQAETADRGGDAKPIKWLWSWREVFDALDLPNNEEQRRRVTHANDKFNGPIIVGGQGTQPKADKAKLIEWWNRLEIEFTNQRQGCQGAMIEAKEQHPYGKQGTVAPRIGSVKKRRRK
jgi:hypothetical protein